MISRPSTTLMAMKRLSNMGRWLIYLVCLVWRAGIRSPRPDARSSGRATACARSSRRPTTVIDSAHARHGRVPELARQQRQISVRKHERGVLQLAALRLVHRRCVRDRQHAGERRQLKRDQDTVAREHGGERRRPSRQCDGQHHALIAIEQAAIIVITRDHHGRARGQLVRRDGTCFGGGAAAELGVDTIGTREPGARHREQARLTLAVQRGRGVAGIARVEVGAREPERPRHRRQGRLDARLVPLVYEHLDQPAPRVRSVAVGGEAGRGTQRRRLPPKKIEQLAEVAPGDRARGPEHGRASRIAGILAVAG